MTDCTIYQMHCDNAPAYDLVGVLQKRYENRGLAGEARAYGKKQEENEDLTASMYPEAYSMWYMDEEDINRKYRVVSDNGECYMDTESYVRYFKECRGTSMNVRSAVSAVSVNENDIQSPVSEIVTRRSINKDASIKDKARRVFTDWLGADINERAKKERRNTVLSLSLVLLILAVFASLMMVVFSSAMISIQKSSNENKRAEYEALLEEKRDLETKREIQNDTKTLQEAAVSPLSMLNTRTATGRTEKPEESIEVYDVEQETRVDFSTILSAIGFKK